MRRIILRSAMFVGAALVLSACGSDAAAEGSDNDAPTATLVVLGQDIRFDAETYEAAPGPTSLVFNNVGAQPHNLVFEDAPGAPVVGAADVFDQPGASVTSVVDLEPGSFLFFCSIPGHREAGMEAILDVS